jgi:capsular polysaccharide transport system ATP-binding protein
MISMTGVNKFYQTRFGRIHVLKDIDFTINPNEKIGILGRNGAGKSTMIRLLSGAEEADSGRVKRSMSVSWPLAFTGAFQGALSGLDNLKFICRVYGKDYRDKIDFVQDFSELGRFLREPVRNYSQGMQMRLAFAISMVIEFDCFLIDEIVAVGDARFHAKCHEELFVKRADRGLIIVSHDPGYVREHCHRACVLESGRLIEFNLMDEAYEHYSRLLVSS